MFQPAGLSPGLALVLPLRTLRGQSCLRVLSVCVLPLSTQEGAGGRLLLHRLYGSSGPHLPFLTKPGPLGAVLHPVHSPGCAFSGGPGLRDGCQERGAGGPSPHATHLAISKMGPPEVRGCVVFSLWALRDDDAHEKEGP